MSKENLAVAERLFGVLSNGQKISEFTLNNANGITAKIINYGATLTSLRMPDKHGHIDEVTLGFDTLAEYLTHPFYFGCTIGRVANRISNSRFQYQGEDYPLSCNYEDQHHIHGGIQGFDKVVWQTEIIKEPGAVGIKFSYLSPEGAEGYPGNLTVITTYLLTANNELKIRFWARTDKPTPVDLTNHTYWNLLGAGAGDVLGHEIQVLSDRYVVTENLHIPTGEIRSLAGTPFDFNQLTAIGAPLQKVGGYDLCFVLTPAHGQLRAAGMVKEPITGRAIEVTTTQPGLQFYTGNYLVDYPIANNKRTKQYGGFCLETQNFPDAVNHANFPSPFLLPDQVYTHESVFKFIY